MLLARMLGAETAAVDVVEVAKELTLPLKDTRTEGEAGVGGKAEEGGGTGEGKMRGGPPTPAATS